MNFPYATCLHLQQLIPAESLLRLDTLMALIPFENGKATATGAAQAVKDNLQSVRNHNPYLQEAEQLITNALLANPLFHAALLPKIILPITISRYQPGMSYGWHTDSPVMSNMATIRVDMSMTLFLSAPESYTGGELVLHTPTGLATFKLSKGDAIIYPTTRLHCVNPVTSGERVAAVTWLQSMVRDTEKRELLFQLKTVQEMLGPQYENTTEHLLLQQVYSNLTRMWAEV